MSQIVKLLSVVALILFLGACAPLPQPQLQPLSGPAMTSDGKAAAKVDNFQIILDASLSMDEGGRLFVTARNIASRINQGIPTDLNYNAGLRTFGHNSHQSPNPTDLIYGMVRHDRQAFHDSLSQIKYIGGPSPLAAAITASARDLTATGGTSALIIISDGLDMDTAPAAARQAKEQFGDRLCIYTIAVGNERNNMGHDLLQKVAEAGQCGFAATAAELADAGAMSQFITAVFLTDPPPAPRPAPAPAPAPVMIDSDGDGVPDHLDKCPDTPRGVVVDAHGCPLDSDGDGVPDYLDRCPGTPLGVRVDEHGCPTVLALHINFGHDSTRIDAAFDDELRKAAECIINYPGHEVVITGHTDSVGAAAYNQTLSERRALAVKNALAERFDVPQGKMVTRGLGETSPVADNNTLEGRAMNRRVEVACGADVN